MDTVIQKVFNKQNLGEQYTGASEFIDTKKVDATVFAGYITWVHCTKTKAKIAMVAVYVGCEADANRRSPDKTLQLGFQDHVPNMLTY